MEIIINVLGASFIVSSACTSFQGIRLLRPVRDSISEGRYTEAYDGTSHFAMHKTLQFV